MRKPLQVAVMAAFVLLLSRCASDSIEELLPACDSKTIVVEVNIAASPGCTDTGEVQVTASGASGFTYSLDGINFQSSATFTALGAGNYTVRVQDDEGCEASADFVLTSVDGITLNLAPGTVACGEENGTIAASVTGGTGDYQFSLNGEGFQSSTDFTNLTAGEYEVTVRDSDGCSTTQTTVLTTSISLAADIMPIINANCAISGCHGNSRSPLMNTPEAVIGAASRIRVRALGLDDGRQPMPPSGFISQELQDQIDCWVNDGALDN